MSCRFRRLTGCMHTRIVKRYCRIRVTSVESHVQAGIVYFNGPYEASLRYFSNRAAFVRLILVLPFKHFAEKVGVASSN